MSPSKKKTDKTKKESKKKDSKNKPVKKAIRDATPTHKPHVTEHKTEGVPIEKKKKVGTPKKVTPKKEAPPKKILREVTILTRRSFTIILEHDKYCVHKGQCFCTMRKLGGKMKRIPSSRHINANTKGETIPETFLNNTVVKAYKRKGLLVVKA